MLKRPQATCLITLHSEEAAEKDGGRGLDAVPHSVSGTNRNSTLSTPGLFVAGDGLPHLSTALVGEPLTTRAHHALGRSKLTDAGPCGAGRSDCPALAEWLLHNHQGPGAQALI